MTRDYKHRASTKNQNQVPLWKWLVVSVLIGVFVFFLSFLKDKDSGKKQPGVKAKEIQKADKKPEFQFYTLLKQEQEIPDYEIKIRKREKQLGREKPDRYVLQAGSFKKFKEADKRKAQLALLGVEAQIEKTKIGNQIWNRVKIGPISDITYVDDIRSRLRSNRIDVVVMKRKNP